MTQAILVINTGSSSLKFTLFRAEARPSRDGLLCQGEFEGFGHPVHFIARDARDAVLADRQFAEGTTHEEAIDTLAAWLAKQFPEVTLAAAGHRIVHGGTRYTAPVQIDDAVMAELKRLIPLAPLHQPHNIAGIEALRKRHPRLPQFASFDTAFHADEPAVATQFALPRALLNEGVRRYGFHGLSYEYIASVMSKVIGPAAEGRVVVAHLGAGASMCAMTARKSVATTMGFTALDGLPMGTRCGSLDPGVVLYLIEENGMSANEVRHLLYHQSGLIGVSGISDDMRTLIESTDPRAEEAIRLFTYRIGRELGSLAAALGGLDALIFTAGIGEHAAEVRRRVCRDAVWLGIALDEAANDAGRPRISRNGSRCSAWVIPTDEDLMIARHASDLLRGREP
ncbi:MAG: acetate/propionate family kinase [Stellaceae bacterium]